MEKGDFTDWWTGNNYGSDMSIGKKIPEFFVEIVELSGIKLLQNVS